MNAIIENNANGVYISKSERLDQLISDFNNSFKKTTYHILEMSRIAYEAKGVGKENYTLFCEHVFMKGAATMSKLATIGERYNLFIEHQDKLPSQWTTLYNLTQLETNDFINKVNIGVINTRLTGVESLSLIGKGTPEEKEGKDTKKKLENTDSLVGFKITVSCNSPELASQLNEVVEFAREKGLDVSISDELQSFTEGL